MKKIQPLLPAVAIITVLFSLWSTQWIKSPPAEKNSMKNLAEGEESPDPQDGTMRYEDVDGKLVPVAKFNGKTRQYEPVDLVITEPDFNIIDPKLVKAAQDGRAEEQWMLGTEYFSGDNVHRSYVEAVKWWAKAADQGHDWARLDLSNCYLEGKGVGLDRKKGVQLLRLIIDTSDNTYLRSVSMYRLGWCYFNGFGAPKNFAEGVKWLRKSAESGFFPAQKDLGNAYINGFFGISKDEEQGQRWLKRSEESKQAMVNVMFKETLSK